MTNAIRILRGIGDVAERYDAFILDLWGVIHNGLALYPGAPECLAALRARGKRTALLSNAPRRSLEVVKRLEELGLPRGAYDHIVTSGDLARTALVERRDPFHAALGRRYYRLGPERDWGLMEDVDYAAVPFADAEFVVNTGLFEDETETVDDYEDFMRAALARRLPMICVNPDLTVMRGTRQLPCAGALGDAYAARGGAVVYHGKPHGPAYLACFALFGGVAPARVLGVGDSLRTDIAGAHGAGIDSVLVTSGIHADEFVGADGRPDPARIARAAAGPHPTMAIDAFVW